MVCIDGTANQFGIKVMLTSSGLFDSRHDPTFVSQNTNIVELYSRITKNDKQLTYYSSGLGAIAKFTGAPLGPQLSNNLDMAIGRYVITQEIIADDLILE